jgi:hypothetical protein
MLFPLRTPKNGFLGPSPLGRRGVGGARSQVIRALCLVVLRSGPPTRRPRVEARAPSLNRVPPRDSHSPVAPRRLPMAPLNLRTLMQEHPVKFVERVARLMRIPALRHRRHLLPPPLAAQPLQMSGSLTPSPPQHVPSASANAQTPSPPAPPSRKKPVSLHRLTPRYSSLRTLNRDRPLRRSRLGGRGLSVRDKPQVRPVLLCVEDCRLPLAG